jgi:hypothetical protein
VLLLVAVQLVSEETVGVEGVVQTQVVYELFLVAVNADVFLGVVVVLRDAQQNPVEWQRLGFTAREDILQPLDQSHQLLHLILMLIHLSIALQALDHLVHHRH